MADHYTKLLSTAPRATLAGGNYHCCFRSVKLNQFPESSRRIASIP